MFLVRRQLISEKEAGDIKNDIVYFDTMTNFFNMHLPVKDKRCLPILLAFCFILLAGRGLSQSPVGKISGFTIDANTNKKISGVSISLFQYKDSVLVRTVTSDSAGRFQFLNVPLNRYVIKGTSKELSGTAQTVTIDAASADVAMDIRLFPNSKMLDAVTITSTKPVIAFDGDKLVFNVENAVGLDVSTVFELLRQVPGVVVDNSEESINLNGQTDITILIDDRRRTLTLAQTIQLLKSIPANNLKQIEVLNNKSAKYDAAGSGGVINIVTKKRLGDGYNLQLTNSVTVDRYLSTNSNFYFNYRKGAFSIYSSLGYVRGSSYSETVTHSIYSIGSATQSLNSHINTRNLSKSPYGDLSIDYSINRNHVIGVSASSLYNNEEVLFNKATESFKSASSYKVNNTRVGDYPENLNSFDFIYNGKLDTLGSKIKADIGYIQGYSDKGYSYHNEFTPGSSTTPVLEDIIARLPLQGHQYIYQFDIEKVFKPGRRLSAGFKHTAATINNNVRYDTVMADGLHNDKSRTQNLRYHELLTGSYISYSHKFSKTLSASFGVRYERTRMENLYLDLGGSFTREFNDFFPSASFSVNRQNVKYSINFNRSISRPYYGYLNSYTTYLDPFTLQQGNSGLRPGYVYSVSATALYKKFLHLSAGYSYGNGMVVLYRKQAADTALTIIRPENALNYASFFANSTISYSLLDKRLEGQLKLHGYLYKNRPSSFFYRPEDLRVTGRYTVSINQSYKISQRNSMEMSCFYYGKNSGNQYVTKSMFQADLGLRSKLIQDKLTASVQVTDVFRTMKQSSYIFYEGVNTYSDREYNSTRVKISLVFSLGRLNENFQKNTSSETESKRFKEE